MEQLELRQIIKLSLDTLFIVQISYITLVLRKLSTVSVKRYMSEERNASTSHRASEHHPAMCA